MTAELHCIRDPRLPDVPCVLVEGEELTEEEVRQVREVLKRIKNEITGKR